MTPYATVYGQKPLSMTSYLLGPSNNHELDRTLHTREAILHTLKANLVMAQNKIKKQIDHHRLEHSFTEGDQEFLRLRPYKQASLKDKIPQKLTPKFFGPYKIIQRIGQVT